MDQIFYSNNYLREQEKRGATEKVHRGTRNEEQRAEGKGGHVFHRRQSCLNKAELNALVVLPPPRHNYDMRQDTCDDP